MTRRKAWLWVFFHVLVFVLLLVAVLFSGKTMKTRSVFEGEIPQSDPRVVSYTLTKSFLPSQDWVGLIIRSKDLIYNPKTLRILLEITREMETMATITPGSVRSLTTVRGFVHGQEIATEFLVSENNLNPENVRRRVQNHPLVRNKLVSSDEKSLLVGGYLNSGSNQREAVERLEGIAKKFAGNGLEILPIGTPITQKWMDDGIMAQATVFTIIALSIMVIFFVLFRMVWAGLAMLVVMALGIIEMNLVMILLGISQSVVSSAAPILLIALGVAYFFYFARQAGLADGEPTHRVNEARRILFQPTWLSIAATAIGFGSLLWSFQILSIAEFGLIAGMGVMIIGGLAWTFYPALFVLIPALFPQKIQEQKNSFFEKITLGFINFSARPRNLIVLLVYTVLVGFGISFLHSNSDPYHFFPSSHPALRSLRALEQFGGQMELIVAIQTKDSFDPNTLERLAELEKKIKNFSSIGGVEGLGSLAGYVAENIYPAAKLRSGFPKGIGSVLELSTDPADLERLISRDRKVAFVRVRAKTQTTDFVSDLIAQIRTEANRIFPGLNDVSLTGYVREPLIAFGGFDALWVAINDYIVKGKVWNLISSLWGIWFLALFFVGRLKDGWRELCKRATIVTVPLGFALAGTLGVMGWVGIPLDLASCVITVIGIGVGEDFAIHFLHHYVQKGGFVAAAHEMGDLALYAMLTCAGFSSFAFSTFLPLRQLSWLVGVILILSYAMAAMIVPPLTKVLKIKTMGGEGS